MVTKQEFNDINDVEAAVGFDMEDAIFAQCSFAEIDFVGYDEPTFFDCDFCDCVISDVGVTFYRCNFYDCKFEDADLCGSCNIFNGCTFASCNCQHLFDSSLQSSIHTLGSEIAATNECEGFIGNNFCPMEGSFIAYKKCIGILRENYIVKLLIPETAKRVCADSFKCRANQAKVLEIQTLDGKRADINTVYSFYDNHFEYRVGNTVGVDDFNECKNTCSSGIHFFLDRNHAVNYRF